MGRVREPRIDYDGRRLVAAHGPHKPWRAIIHDTESHDAKGIRDLRGIAEFWHDQGLGYGAQVGIDKWGKSARYVNDDEIAWHTGKHNTGSLGIELIGSARFTPSIWYARPRQLEKCARWLAWWNLTYKIPLKASVEHGVGTHRMFSKAFPADTSHSDPGIAFPLGFVIWRARKLRESGWS